MYENYDFNDIMNDESIDYENPEVQYALGICYLYGKGVEINKDLAMEWLIKAKNQGSQDAEKLMNELNNENKDSVKSLNDYSQYTITELNKLSKTDYYAAYELVKKAIQLQDNDMALLYIHQILESEFSDMDVLGKVNYYAGKIYEERKDYENAFYYFDNGGECNDIESLKKLSEYYERGIFIEKNKDQAFNYKIKYAEFGSSKEKHEIAQYFRKNHSPLKAIEWDQKALDDTSDEVYSTLSKYYLLRVGEISDTTYEEIFDTMDNHLDNRECVEILFNEYVEAQHVISDEDKLLKYIDHILQSNHEGSIAQKAREKKNEIYMNQGKYIQLAKECGMQNDFDNQLIILKTGIKNGNVECFKYLKDNHNQLTLESYKRLIMEIKDDTHFEQIQSLCDEELEKITLQIQEEEERKQKEEQLRKEKERQKQIEEERIDQEIRQEAKRIAYERFQNEPKEKIGIIQMMMKGLKNRQFKWIAFLPALFISYFIVNIVYTKVYDIYNAVKYEEVDLFKDLHIEMDGTSVKTDISLINQTQDERIANVSYMTDKQYDLKNGDKVTITANYDPEIFDEYGIRPKATTKVVTIDNPIIFIDRDTKLNDKQMEQLKNIFNEHVKETEVKSYVGISDDDSIYGEDVQIHGQELLEIRQYNDKKEWENAMTAIYKVNATVEGQNSDQYLAINIYKVMYDKDRNEFSYEIAKGYGISSIVTYSHYLMPSMDDIDRLFYTPLLGDNYITEIYKK